LPSVGGGSPRAVAGSRLLSAAPRTQLYTDFT
jgi:hypothetical protein